MIRTALALSALAVFAAATPALAREWYRIGSDDLGAVVEIDRDAVRVQGSLRIVRSRWTFGPGDTQRAEAVSVEKYDCDRSVLSTAELTTTFRDGRVDRKAWDDDSWEPIADDTTAGAIRDEVCGEPVRGALP